MSLGFDEVCEFFEQTKCPNVFPFSVKEDRCLLNIAPKQTSDHEVIKAIKAVLDALIHLQINMITPCQLREEYIVCVRGVWGIRHAICHRCQNENSEGESYNSQQYAYHSSAEGQLVWNIGKIWLRFFSDKPVDIMKMSQAAINEIIEKNVKHFPSRALIKRLLSRDPHERIHFQSFIMDELFVSEDENLATVLYSSIYKHLSQLTTFMTKSLEREFVISGNPFLKAQKNQRFQQYLEIDQLLEKVGLKIKKQFSTENQFSEHIEFACYIITLQSYKHMVSLESDRLGVTSMYKAIEERKYYAEFVKRLVSHRDYLEKKAAHLKKSNLSKQLKEYLINPQEIDSKKIYIQFRTTLNQCLQDAQKGVRQKKKLDLMTWKLIIDLLMARAHQYLFSNARMEVFRDFLQNHESFDLKAVLVAIANCTEIEPLKNLYHTIHNVYYQSK